MHLKSFKRLFQNFLFLSVSEAAPRWRPATLLRKRLQCWCFPANFAKFLKTPVS